MFRVENVYNHIFSVFMLSFLLLFFLWYFDLVLLLSSFNHPHHHASFHDFSAFETITTLTPNSLFY